MKEEVLRRLRRFRVLCRRRCRLLFRKKWHGFKAWLGRRVFSVMTIRWRVKLWFMRHGNALRAFNYYGVGFVKAIPWRRLCSILLVVLGVPLLLFLSLGELGVLGMLVRHVSGLWNLEEPDGAYYLRPSLITAGAALVAAMFFLWRNLIAGKQLENDQLSLQEERYKEGVELLGHEKQVVRIGGLYTLHQLAEDFPKTWALPVLDLMCIFVRTPPLDKEKAAEPKRVIILDKHAKGYDQAEGTGKNRLRRDVEEAVQLLGLRGRARRREEKREKKKAEKERRGKSPGGGRLDFHGGDLAGGSWRRVDLEGANFLQAKLVGARFFEAKLVGARFFEAKLAGVIFSTSTLTGAYFWNATLMGAHFPGAKLAGANFFEATLPGAVFFGAKLEGAYFSRAMLPGVDFSRAKLVGARFEQATLTGAYFSGAKLTGGRFLEAKLEGARFEKATLRRAGFFRATLTGARFEKATLKRVDFFQCTLTGACFEKATLRRADFFRATLTGANFKGSTLRRVDFFESTLTGANFRGCTLRRVDFVHCTLTGVDFSGVDITGASLRGANLSGVILLATVSSKGKGEDQFNLVKGLTRKQVEAGWIDKGRPPVKIEEYEDEDGLSKRTTMDLTKEDWKRLGLDLTPTLSEGPPPGWWELAEGEGTEGEGAQLGR